MHPAWFHRHTSRYMPGFIFTPVAACLQVLNTYHALAMRWFLVNTQYRQPVNYTQRALDEASDRVYYVYQTLSDVQAALAAAGEEGSKAEAEAAKKMAAGKVRLQPPSRCIM